MVSVPVNLQAVLTRYRNLLTERFGSRLVSIRLFGSQARGDAEPDSEGERTEAMDRAFEAWRNEGSQGPLLSPLVWSDHEHGLRLAHERRIALDIEREGIPV